METPIQQKVNKLPAKKIAPKFFWIKVAFMIISNIICFIAILKIGTTIMAIADEIKKLRATASGSATTNQKDIIESELQKFSDEKTELFSFFPNDDKILDFVIKIDEMKKSGLVTQFNFASNEVVKDRSGMTTLPVLIQMRGTRENINIALKQIRDLNFIIRPATFNLSKVTEVPGEWTLQYGAVLYVDSNFGKN